MPQEVARPNSISHLSSSTRFGRVPASLLTLISLIALEPTFASAQATQPTIEPVTEGTKEIVVSFESAPAADPQFTVEVTGRQVNVGTPRKDAAGRKFTIALDQPRVEGDRISLKAVVADQVVSAETTVQPVYDERGIFGASAYLGSAFDNFAASELKNYINPQAASDIQERFIAGFDFGYRLFGDQSRRATFRNSQIWLYGETLHGVRSADVDCSAANRDDRPPVCNVSSTDPTTFPERTRFILRNATSLEAFMGGRWEFHTFQPATRDAATLYLKGQLGFLTVSESGGDVIDSHHIGLGIVAIKGPLVDSYVEAGWGRTDLFLDDRTNRWKLDGFLSFEMIPGIAEYVKPFAQIAVDSDFGDGADSVQSYLGFDFDLSELF